MEKVSVIVSNSNPAPAKNECNRNPDSDGDDDDLAPPPKKKRKCPSSSNNVKDNHKKKVHKKDVHKKDSLHKKGSLHKKDSLHKNADVRKKDELKKDERKKGVRKKDIVEQSELEGQIDISIAAASEKTDNDDEVKVKKARSTSWKKRRVEIGEEKAERRSQYDLAVNDYTNNPDGMSIYACAKKHNVNYNTLKKILNSGQQFNGQGRVLTVLSKEEEAKIREHIIRLLFRSYSLTFFELRYLIQESLIRLCEANPSRITTFEASNHLPDDKFVYNFATRNMLVLRSTMELSKARSMLSEKDVENWQKDTEIGLVFNPECADCWNDPKRILNQDEVGIQIGQSKVKVLAPRGIDSVLYSKGGGSHEHVSLSVTVNAAGHCVGPRLVYKGIELTN